MEARERSGLRVLGSVKSAYCCLGNPSAPVLITDYRILGHRGTMEVLRTPLPAPHFPPARHFPTPHSDNGGPAVQRLRGRCTIGESPGWCVLVHRGRASVGCPRKSQLTTRNSSSTCPLPTGESCHRFLCWSVI